MTKWLRCANGSSDNRNANTLIFDLRNHHGGGLKEQDVIFAEVFAKPTPLVTMALAKSVYDERGSLFGNVPTLHFAAAGDKMVATHRPFLAKRRRCARRRIYLLVSNKTASAGEHFSLAMKSTGRANADRRSDGRREPLRRPERSSMSISRCGCRLAARTT